MVILYFCGMGAYWKRPRSPPTANHEIQYLPKTCLHSLLCAMPKPSACKRVDQTPNSFPRRPCIASAFFPLLYSRPTLVPLLLKIITKETSSLVVGRVGAVGDFRTKVPLLPYLGWANFYTLFQLLWSCPTYNEDLQKRFKSD